MKYWLPLTEVSKVDMPLYRQMLILYRFWVSSWFFLSLITYIQHLFSKSSYKNPKVCTKAASCLDTSDTSFWFLWYNKYLTTFRNLRKPVLIILKLINEKLCPILSPSKGDYPSRKNLFKARKRTLGWRSTNVVLLLLNRFLQLGNNSIPPGYWLFFLVS